MRRAFALLMAVALTGLCTGCATSPGPRAGTIFAPIQVVSSSLEVGDQTVGYSKKGEAEAEGIILVSFGDNSISAAMEDGGITKIHHVDTEVINILGIYSRVTTIVYGE